MPLLIGLSAALVVPLFVWGYHLKATGGPASDTVLVPAAREDRKPEFGPLGRIVNPVGRPFAPLVLGLISPVGRTRLRRRIDRAGRPAQLTLEGYARNKAGNFVVYGLGGVLGMMSGHLVIGAALVVMGLLQTDIVLWNLSRERQQEIERSLPDFLDVLTVTVSAGLGFRHALQRVAESMLGAVSEEMTKVLQQVELGTPLRDAFEELRRRNDSEALSGFVTAILQAEELGAPLSRALGEISVDMRRDAFQQARRRAQRADPQVTMIVTFLMVPGMLLLIVSMLYWGSGAQIGSVFGG